MIDGRSLQSLELNIINCDRTQVGIEWDYSDIYGPYHRLYLVKDGQATIHHHGQDFHLTVGVLYLIPGFVRASYRCRSFLELVYILFACELEGHFDLLSEIPLQFQVPATELDVRLFDRLLELNPEMALQEIDPKKYHKDIHYHRAQYYCNEVPLPRFLESKSIVIQLLSRFLLAQSEAKTEDHEKDGVGIEKAIRYIKENAGDNITVQQLADITCLSPDYFSKIFKKNMGIGPLEYINTRRLQRVKLLLLTTDKSIDQIGREVGFGSTSYFLRVFKKYEGVTPRTYRKNGLLG